MALFDREAPFLSYVEANSMSFYSSATVTCLLILASLATTPTRHRDYYLRVSAVLILGAVFGMLTAFTNVVQLTLDPQKSWRECLLFYFTVVVQEVISFCMSLLLSLLVLPVLIRILRTSKHPRQDMLKVLAAVATLVITSMVYCTPDVISAVKRVQPGKQDSCSWPGCQDAVFLHPI
jgi:hypothetical protein